MPATETAAASERFVAVPLRDLTGPHDPQRLSTSEFAAALARLAADLPNWPVVVILPYGPAPECLFEQPLDAFKGHVARCAFIGQPRKASRFAREGVTWFARPKGSTVAEAVHCRTYSEALRAAAGIG
jgi:hypothetical protein